MVEQTSKKEPEVVANPDLLEEECVEDCFVMPEANNGDTPSYLRNRPTKRIFSSGKAKILVYIKPWDPTVFENFFVLLKYVQT